MRIKSIVVGVLLGIVLAVSPVLAQEVGRTPPRLSFVDGQVSFYRPGAPDWTEARINIPLAPGDQLYTGSPGNFELQIGARSFVRGWADTHLGLENHENDFLQFKVASGYAAFDLRDLAPDTTVEVNTPNAAFTINRPGYYRADVDGDRTTFTTRRGGSAVATPSGGASITIAPSEEVVLSGAARPAISAYAAPPPDVWDQWNDDRTRDLIEAVSARYVSPEAYGTDDLDRHGAWRVVPTYGSVWIPAGVPAGWAPYSDGTWILDPYYGWTWVDRAPWGWAPYHYGRWVHVHGYWAWAPGPLVVRPVYAPALVAFVGGPGVHFSISFGSRPAVGWVALGWGEPCVPWWGRPGFIHRPWWGGWGGPRVVNDVVIHHQQVISVQHIHHYHHMKHGRGVMAVQEANFGRGPLRPIHVERVDSRNLKMHHTVSRSHATAASFAPIDKQGRRPPQENLSRPTVATRRPHVQAAGRDPHVVRSREASAPLRLVAPPEKRREAAVPKRPSFGQSEQERPTRRMIPNAPPAVERRPVQRQAEIGTPSGRPAAAPSGRPDGKTNENHRSPASLQRQPDSGPQARPAPGLPGRPANALSPGSRERVFQPGGQQSRVAPDPTQPTPAAGGPAGEPAMRERSARQPRSEAGPAARGAANYGQRPEGVLQPRNGQPGQSPGGRPSSGFFQQNSRMGRSPQQAR